jgi:hypothetical protein
MKLRCILLIVLSLITPSFAQDRQFKSGDAVALKPDRAYLLARTFEMKGLGLSGTMRIAPILIRVLSDEELKQAEELRGGDPKHWQEKITPNISVMAPQEPFAQSDGEVTLLTEVKPGTYVLAAVAAAGWALSGTGMMTASLCMGTVKFTAKPGTVTDLGEILTAYDKNPTAIPELEKAVTGKAIFTNMNFGAPAYTVAVRPVPVAALPPALADLPRVPAAYGAMLAFPNYIGAPLSRLAPLPGVLAYDDNGDVIDLQAK